MSFLSRNSLNSPAKIDCPYAPGDRNVPLAYLVNFSPGVMGAVLARGDGTGAGIAFEFVALSATLTLADSAREIARSGCSFRASL